MSKGAFLSTGSGGFGYNIEANKHGAGGGIIFIYAKNNISLINSSVEASGGDVYESDNLSAGSGGTIFMTSKYISGV